MYYVYSETFVCVSIITYLVVGITVHFVYRISLQKYGSIRYCITISTVRIMCHYSLKNPAVVECVTDKLISKLLYYKYRLLIPLQHIRVSHKRYITQHYIATSIFMEHSITIRYSITVLILVLGSIPVFLGQYKNTGINLNKTTRDITN